MPSVELQAALDRFQSAVDRKGVRRAGGRVAPSTRCSAYRQNDEMVCVACGTRWMVTDPDPPLCPRSS